MTTAEIAVLATIAGVLLALIFNLIGNRRATQQDAKRDSADMTTVVVKLENIAAGITEIKADMRNLRDDVTVNRERIVAVEASAKQAHKRIDILDGSRKERMT